MKNQLAAPFRTAQWKMYNVWTEEYGFGIDTTEEVVRLGIKTGVIEGSGWYTHPAFPADAKGDRKINGLKSVQATIKADPALRDTIVSEVLAVLKSDDELVASLTPVDNDAAAEMEAEEKREAQNLAEALA
jgi:recombination protein RecA